jgi:hypothetical protein
VKPAYAGFTFSSHSLLEVTVPFPLAIVGFAGLSALAWHRAGSFHGEPKVLPQSLQYALTKLLDGKLSPEKYKKAAALFRKHGLKAEAELLEKRAKLAALPNSEKAKISAAYSKAMASQKPEGIRAVANALEAMGGVGAAANLRKHANEVQAMNAIQPVDVPPPEPIEDDDAIPVTDDVLHAEEQDVQEADIPAVPPLTEQLQADAASGPTIAPATGQIAEAPPPLAITDDIEVEPPPLDAEQAEMLAIRPNVAEAAAEIEAAHTTTE